MATYTLSFNTRCDTTNPTSIEVEENTAIGTLPEVTRTNYYFLGWYIDNEKIDSETVYNYNTDKTAIAKWNYLSTNANRVEIKFYNNAELTGTAITTKYFDASNLMQLNYTKNSIANADSISFEIASQSGTISMFDKDDYTFQQLNEEGYLSYNEVKIYKNGVEDAIMYLYSPQKDINSIQWQFTLSDLFGKYKEKQFLGLGYGTNTARNCLNAVLGSGNYQLVGITANDAYLDATISNCYLLPDTIWNTLNKICAFALLQGYVIDGVPTFRRSL